MSFEIRDKRINDLINLIKMYESFTIGPEEIKRFLKNTEKLDGLDLWPLTAGLIGLKN